MVTADDVDKKEELRQQQQAQEKDKTNTQVKNEAKTDVPFVCASPQCGKASTLQCPTCVKLALPPTYFCSQDCFRSFWGVHKHFHQKKEKPVDTYNYTGTLRPGEVSPKLYVPAHIPRPEYAISGYPTAEIQRKSTKLIEIRTPKEIKRIREASIIGRKALDLGHSLIRPGITTDEIDKAVHEYITSQGCYPSPLNYYNYPKSICTSINEVICHGIPDNRPLEEGDIINLDISVYHKGMHSDLNETYCVGKVDKDSLYLVEHTYKALEKAIEVCKPDAMYKEVGKAIEKYAKEHGLAVVRSYVGHGVGKDLHSLPDVPHYASNKTIGFMKEGHTFTIEPMLNQGDWKDVLWNDNWTGVTVDGKRSAQFEHTLLITKTGCEVLTKRLEDSPPLDFTI